MSFKNSLKRSTSFYETNKQELIKEFNSFTELVSIELDSKYLANLFDQYAGIDYVLVNNALKKLYGVAARVNFSLKTKGKLTIRYSRASGTDTEFAKRLSSIRLDDSLYPNITMQVDSDINGYMEGGIILKTKELYLFLDKNIDDVKNRFLESCQEGNQYFAIPYQTIKDEFGIRCKIF